MQWKAWAVNLAWSASVTPAAFWPAHLPTLHCPVYDDQPISVSQMALAPSPCAAMTSCTERSPRNDHWLIGPPGVARKEAEGGLAASPATTNTGLTPMAARSATGPSNWLGVLVVNMKNRAVLAPESLTFCRSAAVKGSARFMPASGTACAVAGASSESAVSASRK